MLHRQFFRSAVKMRKKEIFPKEIYAIERGTDTNAKELLNLVVVGHVDSGKSTLMGHLLFELGQGKCQPKELPVYIKSP